MRVYIGYDKREHDAAKVARKTLKETSSIEPEFLERDGLAARGLLNRPTDRRNGRYDLLSDAYSSTEFSLSRFLVPILCQSGPALFTDCDVVFLRDVSKLKDLFDPQYAVQVVRHNYTPSAAVKMDNQVQSTYSRKNWSSVVLWNTDHPANRRLTLHDVNTRPGLWLHQFGWLNDHEIGDLPPRWNWLVGEQSKPDFPAIAHYTLGGPFTPGWIPHEHDEIWQRAAA